MAKGVNLSIKETKDKLLETINTSNLPISVITMILEKLLNEASNLEKQAIMKEYEESKLDEDVATEFNNTN